MTRQEIESKLKELTRRQIEEVFKRYEREEERGSAVLDSSSDLLDERFELLGELAQIEQKEEEARST